MWKQLPEGSQRARHGICTRWAWSLAAFFTRYLSIGIPLHKSRKLPACDMTPLSWIYLLSKGGRTMRMMHEGNAFNSWVKCIKTSDASNLVLWSGKTTFIWQPLQMESGHVLVVDLALWKSSVPLNTRTHLMARTKTLNSALVPRMDYLNLLMHIIINFTSKCLLHTRFHVIWLCGTLKSLFFWPSVEKTLSLVSIFLITCCLSCCPGDMIQP